jgi:hypothetical protein
VRSATVTAVEGEGRARAEPSGRFAGQNLAGWLAARRYGLPASMVSAATRRRLAGDWRGACAAAWFDVEFDLAEVRRRHGSAVAAAIEEDLHHLVPDLVRWHLPRSSRDGRGLLHPGHTVVLGAYDGEVVLSAHTPVADRPQRVRLRVGPGSDTEDHHRDSWTEARCLWDDRHVDRLLARMGGGDRLPFFERDGRRRRNPPLSGPVPTDPVALMERVIGLQDAGRVPAAWQAAGVQANLRFAAVGTRRVDGGSMLPEELAAMVPAFVRPAQALLGLAGVSRVVLRSADSTRTAVVLMLGHGGLRAHQVEVHRTDDALPLARALWRRMPDLELLRHGLITAAELHPLVRAALFPEQPDPGYRPAVASTVDVGSPVPVRCAGRAHRVAWRSGRLEPLDHPAEEVARERALRALGGPVPACVAAADAWRAGGDLPEPLDRLREHGLTAVLHGHADELVRLVDAGIDPRGLRDERGRGPLHLLARMSDVDGPAVLARLLAEGLDLAERDEDGESPLARIVADGGAPELVRALLRAGADPRTVVDERGRPQMLGWFDRTRYAFLVEQVRGRGGMNS